MPTKAMGFSSAGVCSVRPGHHAHLRIKTVSSWLANVAGFDRWHCVWPMGDRHDGSIHQHLTTSKGKCPTKNQWALPIRSPPDVPRLDDLLWSVFDRQLFALFRFSMVGVAVGVGLQDSLRRAAAASPLSRLRIVCQNNKPNHPFPVLSKANASRSGTL